MDAEEPDHICCPITFTIFRDPVLVVSSGQTYDRDAIMKHFKYDDRDPLTGVHLENKDIVPNIQTRRTVEAWLNERPKLRPKGWGFKDELKPVRFSTIKKKQRKNVYKWCISISKDILSMLMHFAFILHLAFFIWNVCKGVGEGMGYTQ